MLKLIHGMLPDVLAVEAIGKVTDEDYRTILIPLAEQMIKKGPIRMLYVVGPEAVGFEAGALWDDGAFGLKHGHDFSEIAVVTEQPWLKAAVGMFAPLIRARVRLLVWPTCPRQRPGSTSPAWFSASRPEAQGD